MAGLLRVGVGRADRELGSGVVGGGLDRDLFETGLGREQLGVRVEGGTERRPHDVQGRQLGRSRDRRRQPAAQHAPVGCADRAG